MNYDLFFNNSNKCSYFKMFITLKFPYPIIHHILHPVASLHISIFYNHHITLKKMPRLRCMISTTRITLLCAILYRRNLLQSRHSYWCSRGKDRDLRRLEKETGSLERPPIANTTPEAMNGSHYRRWKLGSRVWLSRIIFLSYSLTVFLLFLFLPEVVRVAGGTRTVYGSCQ